MWECLEALALELRRKGVQRVRSFVQGDAAAVVIDAQAKTGSEAPANNYTAQYTVYTQRAKSLADEVRFSCRHLI